MLWILFMKGKKHTSSWPPLLFGVRILFVSRLDHGPVVGGKVTFYFTEAT